MSRQFWSECLAWATADGTAISATVTETIIFPNVTIPANFMQDGRALRITAYGRHTSAGQTVTLRLRWGGVSGTVICASGANVAPTATAALWEMEAIIQTRSNGSSGTVFSMGRMIWTDDVVSTAGSATGAPIVGLMGSAGLTTPAAVTVDLTADTALSITGTFGTAGSNAMTGHIYIIEALN
jgi:hypothetical protein